jgi:hypothetical protein
MPQVELDCDIRTVFAKARELSAGLVAVPDSTTGGRAVAVITPGRLIMHVACPPASTVSSQMLESVRRLVPENPKLQITVIAYNNVVLDSAFTPGKANTLIPFLGYLVGLAFDGHTVVVFEGHRSALAAGCEGSTLLLVDQAMVEHLQADWASVAASAMRAPNILMFCRDGSVARIVPTGGSTAPPAAAVPSSRRKRSWWPFGGGN